MHLDDMKKAATKSEADGISAVRKKFKNTLHLAVSVLMDHDIWCLCRLICFVMERVRIWHGKQVKLCKSCEESLQWHIDQACGKGYEHLSEIVGALYDRGRLQDLFADIAPKPAKGSIGDHPSLDAERRYVRVMVCLVFSLLGRRAHTDASYSRGLPGVLLGLASAEHGDRIRDYIQLVWIAYQVALRQTSAFWRKLLARSPFLHRIVEQVIRLLVSAVWLRSADVQRACSKPWEGIT